MEDNTENSESPPRDTAGPLEPLLQAGMVLTVAVVHIVVVTPEALPEAGVQEELREEVSGGAEEAAGKSKKLIGDGSQRVLLFLVQLV